MTVVTDIIASATEVIGKFIPDADKRIEAELELAKIADGAQNRYDDRLMGQIEINKIEAANPNIWVSGWRPFIGWVGGGTVAWTFIVAPTLHAYLPSAALPAVDSQTVVELVFGLLGIGGTQRMIEKMAGVATASVPKQAVTTNPVKVIKGWFT